MAYPADFETLQDAVMGKLRVDENDRAKVKDWINQVYVLVCVELELLHAVGTAALVAGEASYSIDARIAIIKELTITGSDGSVSEPLEGLGLEELMVMRAAGDTVADGAPAYYCLTGHGRLELYPTPSSADTLTMRFVSRPDALVDDDDEPVIQEPWRKVIEYGALYEAATFQKDPDVLMFREDFEAWLRRYRAHLNRRAGEGSHQLRVVGEHRRGFAGNDRDVA